MKLIAHDRSRAWVKRRNLKRETEFLLIAAQNNAIRTNYIKAKSHNTQQNSKCRLRGDRNETRNSLRVGVAYISQELRYTNGLPNLDLKTKYREKTLLSSGFFFSTETQSENKSKRKYKVGSCLRAKFAW